MYLAVLDEVIEEAPPLPSACFTDTQNPLDKPTAVPTVRTTAPLPPKDGMTQRPLGGIICRLDTSVPDKRP
jgi:hypothetical protein